LSRRKQNKNGRVVTTRPFVINDPLRLRRLLGLLGFLGAIRVVRVVVALSALAA
jgi:hypothetical protein